MEFEGRVALVTGAARGIGRAIVERLAAGGADVAFSFRTSEAAAAEVAAGIERLGRRVYSQRADVTQPREVAELVEGALRALGRIDILVNNAGITRDALLVRMSEQDWDAVLETNLGGAYLCTRACLRAMLRQRYGRIMNVSSVSGIVGNPGQANYAAAKAGLIGFTRSVAREVASRGITVNAVAPGYIQTDIWDTVSEGARRKAMELIPLGRAGTPAEVAEAVAFLVSDVAGYITGQVLNIDGGMVMA